MRIFLGEFICGGGLIQHAVEAIPGTLRREGSCMLSALREDLSSFADVITPVDPRLVIHPSESKLQKDNAEIKGRIECHTITRAKPFLDQWLRIASKCDAAIIIAPETDGCLLQIIQTFRANSISVIGPSEEFTRIASDKLITAQRMETAKVPHPPTWFRLSSGGEESFGEQDIQCTVAGLPESKKQQLFVMKPRDGCGSEDIKIVDHYDEGIRLLGEREILQPWIGGKTISAAIIATNSKIHSLPAVAQKISRNSFEYLGGQGPLNQEEQERAGHLTKQVIDAMPILKSGFVGIDLILGKNKKDDFVVEINPRLTTSYVGLRKIVKGNLAKCFFSLESGSVGSDQIDNSVTWDGEGHVVTHAGTNITP